MTQHQAFTVTQPTRIQFGAGSISDLGKTVKEFNGTNVFLVVDPGLVKAGLISPITTPLEKTKSLLPYMTISILSLG